LENGRALEGVETVAFRTDDGGLSVETEDGREQVPIGYWAVKNGIGIISLVPPDEFNVLFVQTPIE
jgi:hypothetical protein